MSLADIAVKHVYFADYRINLFSIINRTMMRFDFRAAAREAKRLTPFYLWHLFLYSIICCAYNAMML